jgi:hypothetical protein
VHWNDQGGQEKRLFVEVGRVRDVILEMELGSFP